MFCHFSSSKSAVSATGSQEAEILVLPLILPSRIKTKTKQNKTKKQSKRNRIKDILSNLEKQWQSNNLLSSKWKAMQGTNVEEKIKLWIFIW